MSEYVKEVLKNEPVVFVGGHEVQGHYEPEFFMKEQESDTLKEYRGIDKKIYDTMHVSEGMVMNEKSYEDMFDYIREILSTYVSREDREIEKEILKGYMIHSVYSYNVSLSNKYKRCPVNQEIRDEWREKEDAYEKKQEKNKPIDNEPTFHELSSNIYNNLIRGK